MKTIKEWFETLEEPYRTEAINNTEGKKLNSKQFSLIGSLEIAFIWQESLQKQEYWEGLYLSLKKERGY